MIKSAAACNSVKDHAEVLKLLEKHQDKAAKDCESGGDARKTWLVVLGQVASDVSRLLVQPKMDPFRDKCISLVERLLRPSDKQHYEILGTLSFQRGQCAGESEHAREFYQKAVHYWEKAGTTEHQNCFLAKARVLPYPDCLPYWEIADAKEDIIKACRAHAHTVQTLSWENRRRINRACRELGQIELAVSLVTDIKEEDKIVELSRDWLLGFNCTREQIVKYLRGVFREMAKQERNLRDLVQKWTGLLFDLAEDLVNQDTDVSADERGTWVLETLQLASSGRVVSARLERMFPDKRDVGTQAATRQEAKALHFLNWFINTSYKLAQEAWEKRDYHGTASLLVAALGAFWEVVDVEKTEVQEGSRRGKIGSLEAEWVSYVLAPAGNLFSPSEGVASAEHFLAPVQPALRQAAEKAMQILTDGPSNWLRSITRPEYTEPAPGALVDAIARKLILNLRHIRNLLRDGKVNVVPDWKWWQLAGRFIDQVIYHLAAVNFYRDLREMAEMINEWPAQCVSEINNRLHAAEEEHRKFRHTPGFLSPGDEVRLPSLRITVHSDLQEIFIYFQPDEIRVRIKYDPARAELNINADDEVTVFQMEKGPTSYKAQLKYRSMQVTIERQLQSFLIVYESQTWHVSFQ